MTVKEARKKRVCRICGKPISLAGGPKDAEFEFSSQMWPQKITFDFGAEFAHTDCLEPENTKTYCPCVFEYTLVVEDIILEKTCKICGTVKRNLKLKPEEYIRLCTRTESTFNDTFEKRLEHGSIGLCTEVGEFQDQLKRWKFYGKDLDKINLIEEVGDLLWYISIILSALDTTYEEAMIANILKLHKRYPEKFSSQHSLIRNLDVERKSLESSLTDKGSMPP
jgi:NTP pyrophosphatase (non-canonical NTP hydrolase)